jgi:hypothetical protein
MRKLWLGLWFWLSLTSAYAQSNFTMPPPAGVVVIGAQVVTSCGVGTLITTNPGYLVTDTTGKLCVNATVSATATISGTIATSPATVTPVTQVTSPWVVNCTVGCSGSSSSTTSVNVYQVGGVTIGPSLPIVPTTQVISVATALGNPTDAPCTLPATSTGCSLIATDKAAANGINGPIQPGANVIGAIFGSPNVTPTDCSISLTTGGTAQNIISATTSLHGFTTANIDPSSGSGEPIWISFTGTASPNTAGSYPLAAPTATTFAGLASYTTPLGFGVNHAVSVVAATTGHKISCTNW